MKLFPSLRRARADTAAVEPQHDRRGLVVGAGVAAGAALAVAALRPAGAVAPVAAEVDVPAADGYQLTEHVLRYYETTRA